MKRFMLLAVVLAVPGVREASAQSTCANASTSGMTSAAIIALVSNQYACVGTSPNAEWNELHDSGSGSGNVLDYKLGPANHNDPSDTAAHPTGTFMVTAPTGSSAPGVITYTYSSGSYGYYVVNGLTPPQYLFCGQSGGAPNLSVRISPSHC